MHKKIILLIAVIMVVIGIILISRNKSQLPVIKIGATLPLTGTLSYIGEEEKNGLELAAEEINANGGVLGKKISLMIEDNQGQETSAVSSASKLLNVDGVSLLFSSFTHLTSAIKGVAAEKGVVMVYHSTVSNIAKENRYFFQDYFNIRASANLLAEYASINGYKAVGMFSTQSQACFDFEKFFEEKGKSVGVITADRERYAPAEKNFRLQVLKLKDAYRKKRIEAIVVCAALAGQDVFMKQLQEFEMLKIPTLQSNAPFLPVADTQEIRTLYERNNTITTWYGFPEVLGSELQRAFIDKYQKRFGRTPRPDAGYAYDDLFVVVNALRNCNRRKQIDSDCIAEKLLKTEYEGVGGRLTFDNDGVSNRNMFLMKVEGGVWKRISNP